MGILKSMTTLCTGMVLGGFGILRLENYEDKKTRRELDRYKKYFDVLYSWIQLRDSDTCLEEKLKMKGCRKIAIYGYGTLGRLLVKELLNTSIDIAYIVDSNAENIKDCPLFVQTIDDEMEKVDAIVVTVPQVYDLVENQLKERVNFSIISLEELISY